MTPFRTLPPLATTLLAALAFASAGQEATPVAAPEPLKIEGVENAFRLSPNLYSGGDPRGEAALAALKKLGVRTILSVDGVAPDAEAARRLGMRYVHLPIGYDGVPREQAVRMVRAVRDLPGPLYVHCHHGIHRGPAAAAICALASEGWDPARAADWMKVAGTSADYRGLYESVREFAPPTEAELEAAGAELPERSPVPALVELMAQVDERWDALKAVQKAGFRAPADRPDLDPTAEALQLLELYREASRLPDSKARGEAFLEQTASAEGLADELYRAMGAYAKQPSPDARGRLEASFAAAGKSCKACHAAHRDG